ncbi:MAG: hypothetical protein K0R24_2010, partial [Gammaproteobacteria bacterium]|nr:hypothetical protein [Gammaproteobacteria bacterium]
AARKTLGYDKQERADLQPADLLQSYLPKEAPEEKKPEESEFDYQIRIRNHVATALKNNMVPIFTGLFTQARNHGRAARLVLLEEMLGVFNDTLTNELFIEEDIEKMSKELSVKLDEQKEFFRGPFNSALQRLQSDLDASTQRAIKTHKQLRDINAWIAEGKKANTLKHNLVQIQDRITTLRDINSYDRLTIEARNKLSTYIASDSVIAKQLLDIDQGIEENPDQNKVSALAKQLKFLETALKESPAICELPGGIFLMGRINSTSENLEKLRLHHLARAIEEINQAITDNLDEEKVLALSEELNSLKTALESQVIRKLRATTSLIEKINSISQCLEKLKATQSDALEAARIAAKNEADTQRENEETVRATQAKIKALKDFVKPLQAQGEEDKHSPQEFQDALKEIMKIDASSDHYVTETEAILLDAARCIPANSLYREKIDDIATQIERSIPPEFYFDREAVQNAAEAIKVLARKSIMRKDRRFVTFYPFKNNYLVIKNFDELVKYLTKQQPLKKEIMQNAIKESIQIRGTVYNDYLEPSAIEEVVTMMELYFAAETYKAAPSEQNRNAILEKITEMVARPLIGSHGAEEVEKHNTLITELLAILSLVESIPTYNRRDASKVKDLRDRLKDKIHAARYYAYQYETQRLPPEEADKIEKEKVIEKALKLESNTREYLRKKAKDDEQKLLKEKQVQKKQAIEACVNSNMEMLTRAEARANNAYSLVFADLEKIQTILNQNQEDYEDYIEQIKIKLESAAQPLSLHTADAGASLMLRIAINNIAREIGHEIPLEKFGSFVSPPANEQRSPAHAEADPVSREQAIAKAIEYETRRFILLIFGENFIARSPAIFGENFTEEDFFSKVLEPMVASKLNENVMQERIIAILKATSMSDRPDTEITSQAIQIAFPITTHYLTKIYQKDNSQETLLALVNRSYEVMKVIDENIKKGRKNNLTKAFVQSIQAISLLLQDLPGAAGKRLSEFNQLLSPYNTQVLRLKKDAERHVQPSAVEDEKEMEITQERAEAESNAITNAIKTYLDNNEEKTEGNFLNRAIASINAEKMMPYPSEQKMADEIIKKEKVSSQHAYQTIALAHIHIAAKNYQKNPSSSTREELLLTVESVISAVEKDYKCEKFGNRKGYGKPLNAVLNILLKSPINDKERLELENLSKQLAQVILSQEQIKKIEAAKREVESNLRVLREGLLIPSRDKNRKIVIKELEKITEILESSNSIPQELITEALTKAANYVSRDGSIKSLMFRIAINNIASKILPEGSQMILPEFGKSLKYVSKQLYHPQYKIVPPAENPGSLGYETKKFVLSKFGKINQEKITIAGKDFTPDKFFHELLEFTYKKAVRENSYDAMKKRIIAILKASSMQGKEDSEIEIEATQIFDCLQVYDAAITQQKQNCSLASLTNKELPLSPFNPTLQRLKKYAAAPAAEEKEMERVQETPEQATQVANAIKAIINNYIKLIGNDANAAFKKAYEIMLTENTKQRFPNLDDLLPKIDKAVGSKHYYRVPQLSNLLHIYIAAEKYQKYPCQFTRDELLIATEATVNVNDRPQIYSNYTRTLEAIQKQLSNSCLVNAVEKEGEALQFGNADSQQGSMGQSPHRRSNSMWVAPLNNGPPSSPSGLPSGPSSNPIKKE